MPLTFLFTLVAAAGITGVPLFNGFVSKCLIHHALVEAFEYQHLASLAFAEKVYIVTCGGTACSFIKLIGFVFLGTAKREYGPEVVDAPPRMLAGMALLGVPILVLGLWPALLLEGVFAPGLQTWGLSSELLTEFLEKMFLSPADLLSAVTAFAIGTVIFVVGVRFGLFHLHAPAWFGVNYWYVAGARAFMRGCEAVQRWYERYLAALSHWSRTAFTRGCEAVQGWYERYLAALSHWSRTGIAATLETIRLSQRRWHRLVAEPAWGTPEVGNARFLRQALLQLELARQSECPLGHPRGGCRTSWCASPRLGPPKGGAGGGARTCTPARRSSVRSSRRGTAGLRPPERDRPDSRRASPTSWARPASDRTRQSPRSRSACASAIWGATT